MTGVDVEAEAVLFLVAVIRQCGEAIEEISQMVFRGRGRLGSCVEFVSDGTPSFWGRGSRRDQRARVQARS